MQISFDPRNRADIEFVEKLLAGLSSSGLAEPEVAQNPGSTKKTIASEVRDRAGSVETNPHSQDEVSAPVSNNVVNLRELTTDQTLDNTAAASPAPTYEDLKINLNKYAGVKGYDAGFALLKKYKAARMIDVKVEDYADFIKECVDGAR